jgi:hypothetical protein
MKENPMPAQPGRAVERVDPGRRLPAGAPSRELDFDEMMRRAEVLAKSGLVVDALKNNPAACALVGMYGAEHGVPLTTSLTQIDVIENRPDPSAQLRVAIIRRAGHQVRWGETTEERAVIRGRRKENRNDPDAWVEVVWTIEMARKAGLVNRWVEKWFQVKGSDNKTRNKKFVEVVGDDRGIFDEATRRQLGLKVVLPEWATELLENGEVKFKDNWAKYTADMLRARASKALSRMEFSDVMAALDVPDDEEERDQAGDVDPEFVVEPAGDDPEDDEIYDVEVLYEDGDVDQVTGGGGDPNNQEPIPSPPAAPSAPAGEPSRSSTEATDAEPSAGAAETAPAPAGWDGERWRTELKARKVKVVDVLRKAATLAKEGGTKAPATIDDLAADETLASGVYQQLQRGL